MIERAWLPGDLDLRGVSKRRVGGKLRYRSKGMLSSGAGRGPSERALGEVIERGAFKFSAERVKQPDNTDDIFALSSHDPTKPLASVRSGTMEVADGPDGLDFEATLPNTTAADDVLELIRTGIARGISFGFLLPPKRRVPQAMRMEREPFKLGDVEFPPEPDVPGADVRVITDLILFEISLAVARPVFRDNQADLRALEPAAPKRRAGIWLP